MRPDSDSNDHHEAAFSEARRRLLKLAVYVPPAIMGMAMFNLQPAEADEHEDGEKKKKKKKKKRKESCAPHLCRPQRPANNSNNENGNENGNENMDY